MSEKVEIKILRISEERESRAGNKFFVIEDEDETPYYIWEPELLAGLNIGDMVTIEHTGGQYPKVINIETEVSEGSQQQLKQVMPQEEEATEIVQELEKRDEKQLEKEIMGETILDYFYQIKLRGKTITGLSIAGMREIARRMGNIKVSEPKIEDKDDRWICKTEVSDLLRNVTAWGVSQQLKKMKLRDKTEIEDEFALQKCYSKSLRNALRSLIPERLVSHMLQKFIEEKEKNKNVYPKIVEEKTL